MPVFDVSSQALTGSGVGRLVTLPNIPEHERVAALEANGKGLVELYEDAGGLLVVRGLKSYQQNPGALVALARWFGPDVENIRETLTAARFFHETVPEVMVLSNQPPCMHACPPAPQPRFTLDGDLVVQFPHQANWHTDQSYRRPPPDTTLLLGLECPPPDRAGRAQGQTLFADCTGAYAALDEETRNLCDNLVGLHAPSWIGRTADDVRAGRAPKEVLAHQQPVRQPVVRHHPVTGQPSLYICEEKQMDHVDGPFVGMETGPDGAGARLLHRLLVHCTAPQFVYAHAWEEGDLVIADNRCLLHAATWYDADVHARLMWRCTVSGNPGATYAGEAPSWKPAAGVPVMLGLENA